MTRFFIDKVETLVKRNQKLLKNNTQILARRCGSLWFSSDPETEA